MRSRHLSVAAILAAAVGMVADRQAQAAGDEPPAPNIIVIYADDLGYGDLSCYGHPTIRTPHLDRMAAEGLRFTQFYSAAEVCTPSRAALMTGRLPVRNGMASSKRRVLFPNSTGGIPADETTLAEALRDKGYQTCCIGKWHLGHLPQYLPTRHGFDRYFGLPYSNDMKPLPLMRGEETLELEPDQRKLTRQYTDEAVQFIRQSQEGDAKGRPFFLYLPHSMPHVPLFAGADEEGRSTRGLYGDVVQAIDHSTGVLIETLRDLELEENTLVVFSSDNGPWLIKKEQGGSAGLLREGKGSTWEGGMRVPGIFWWPGKIKAGQVSQQLASTLDVFATCCTLAGAELPSDRVLDSYDLAPVLFQRGESPRNTMFYYRGDELFAVRKGPWKLHLKTRAGYGQRQAESHDPPQLYQLEHDPSEQFNLAADQTDVIAELRSEIESHLATVTPVENQLD